MATKYKRVRFDYALPATVVAANGVANPILVMDSDYDFEMDTIKVQRTAAGLTVEMFDAAAGGAGFQSNPVPIDLWGGTAQLPATFIPQLWKARQVFNFRLTDTSAAPNTVTIVFSGYKLVPATADDQRYGTQG